MRFLLVNDDGIDSKGLEALGRALSQIGDVYICAPHEQKSTTGHCISLFKPIEAKELEHEEFPYAAKAWECTGYPADCTKMGIYLMSKEGVRPDMVFSGINHGGNMGHDTFYSGTVAAAAEGSFYGIQSVAVSIDAHEPTRYELACKLAVQTALDTFGKVSPEIVININTPDIPLEKIKGVKVVPIGERKYTDHYEERNGNYYLEGVLLPYSGEDQSCDVARCEDGYGVITPMMFNLTDYSSIKQIEEIYKL